jgi:hypothetical protein
LVQITTDVVAVTVNSLCTLHNVPEGSEIPDRQAVIDGFDAPLHALWRY